MGRDLPSAFRGRAIATRGDRQKRVPRPVRKNFDPAAFAEYLASDSTHEAFVVAADMRSARLPPGARSSEVECAPGISVMYEGTWENDWTWPEEPFSLDDWVERDLVYFDEGLRDFQLLELPNRTTVSACEAIELTTQSRYTHRDLPDGVTMRDRMLYIYQGPAIYSVHMFDYPALDPPLTYSFDTVIPSLRIL